MNPRTKRLLRNFTIEVLIYSVLLLIYFVVVLQWLGEPVNQLFSLNPWVYAMATLLLIVVQSVALEMLTTFLINRLGLEKMD